MGSIFTPYSQLHCWMCEMRNGKRENYNGPIIPSANNFKHEMLSEFSSKISIFLSLLYLCSVISLYWQKRNLFIAIKEKLLNRNLIKMLILEENFKRHLEAFAYELFICTLNAERNIGYYYYYYYNCIQFQKGS